MGARYGCATLPYMSEKIYDIAVIGGGINGVGIARDAAGRGLSTVLLEQSDFASATSSASTKLIHGGLRYLEYYEFGLVRAALKEREVLLSMAPHIIWPLKFILPHAPSMRPAWLIRLGLFLYDHIGGRKILPKSRSLKLDSKKIKSSYPKGFSYADCWVDDSRLVVLNARDAQMNKADIYSYSACQNIKVVDGLWHIEGSGKLAGRTFKARKLVNAAGPWVRSVLDENKLSNNQTHQVRLVKGSHIIVPRLFDGEECYILQQVDGRIVFIIPYEDDYSLIGTTDVEYMGDASCVGIDQDEIAYLCDAVNTYLESPISSDDIVSSYSGVRPLLDSGEDDASAVTRDYILDYTESYGAPLLSIFGGKITTYRVLAEKAVDMMTDEPAWTKGAALPGASYDEALMEAYKQQLESLLPDGTQVDVDQLMGRWARQYGALIGSILDTNDLGQYFGQSLFQAEVDYLIRDEFAESADDILWRRTKLGLKFTDEERKSLSAYLKEKKN